MAPFPWWQFGIQAATTGFGIFSGNEQAAAAGKAQRRQEKKTHNYNQDLYQYNTNEADRFYEYQVDALQIQKNNDAANAQYRLNNLRQDRDYKMGIRDFEYDQQRRVFDVQLQRFADQRGFNQIAYYQAMQQQNQYMHETLVGMEFDEAQTLLNFTAASAGLELKKESARATADIQLGQLRDTSYQALDVARSKTAFGKRQANIEALKAGGQLAASGSVGKSVGKGQQGIKAELGAAKAQMSKQLVQQQRQIMTEMYYNQRSIVNQLLTTEASADLDLINLNAQLDLDQAKMSASRDNLMANDKLVRERIKAQRLQADLNNVMPLEPQRTPPIPEIIEPPIPQYAEIFKPGRPPEPVKGVGYAPSNPYAALGQVAAGVSNFVGSEPFQDFLTQQMTPKYDLSQIGSTFNPNINLGIASPAGFNLGGFGSLAPDIPFSIPTGGLVSNPSTFNLNQNFF